MSEHGALQHRARKRFGQNFLHDRRVIERIVDAIDPRAGQTIVEIGPGQAALTRELVRRAGHITALEIDRDLAAWLRGEFTPQQLTLVEADALEFDWSSLTTQPLRVVGNLPYNISSPLLFRLVECADRVVDQHFMLQKEVVDRMVAPPGTKIYGRLDCPSALRAIARGQYVQHRVFFADEHVAIAAGYRPCGSCLRSEYRQWRAVTKS